MDILELIKKRATIRKYQNKSIPKKILDKIIEAGIWGPSIVGRQPGFFVVIKNKKIINKIRKILLQKTKLFDVGGRFVLNTSIKALETANTLIVVYNTGNFVKTAVKFGDWYHKFAKLAEISAISAGIQNMILTTESLGIGSCWIDTPVFFKKEMDKLLNINAPLFAVLILGYPDEQGRRSPRKSLSETVKYIK